MAVLESVRPAEAAPTARDRILDMAQALFAEHGYAAASTRAIAQGAGELNINSAIMAGTPTTATQSFAKALGTGLSGGVFWRDMEVVNLPSGQPTLRLTGGAAQRLAELLPPDHAARLHISLTDDPPLAQAFVIIEALPGANAA